MSQDLISHPGAELSQASGRPQSHFGVEDVQLPQLVLSQALSKAVGAGKAKAGDWFNTLTEENYGKSVTVVVALDTKNRVRLAMGQGLRCRSLDTYNGNGDPGLKVDGRGELASGCAICPHKDWPQDRRNRGEHVDASLAKPECELSFNYIVYIVASEHGPLAGEMAIMRMKSTASYAAKRLNTFLFTGQMSNPNLQWWHRQFKLTAVQEKNDKGIFYKAEVLQDGKPSDEAAAAARRLAELFGGRDLTEGDVDYEAPAQPAYQPPTPVPAATAAPSVAADAPVAAATTEASAAPAASVPASPVNDDLPF